jgi:hypothetical protein
MAQQSNDLRERLLASLPQPENLTNYREETAKLLTKHDTALRWDYVALNAFYTIAMVLFFISVGGPGWHVSAAIQYSFRFGSAVLLFAGLVFELRYRIYSNQVATLKELKQVQFQILELQASLGKQR